MAAASTARYRASRSAIPPRIGGPGEDPWGCPEVRPRRPRQSEFSSLYLPDVDRWRRSRAVGWHAREAFGRLKPFHKSTSPRAWFVHRSVGTWARFHRGG